MTTGLFDTDGQGGGELTGIESRTLRALLGLERRHVAILAEIVTGQDVTTERVTQWEVSKGRGYPVALADHLRGVLNGVSNYAWRLASQTEEAWRLLTDPDGRDAAPEGGRVLVIRRPRGAKRILQVLALPAQVGRPYTPEELRKLDDGGGDFWQRLADAAVVEAAHTLSCDLPDAPIHVAYELADE